MRNKLLFDKIIFGMDEKGQKK